MINKKNLLSIRLHDSVVKTDTYIETHFDTNKLFRPITLTLLYTDNSKYAISNTRVSYCKLNIEKLIDDYKTKHNIEKYSKEDQKATDLIYNIYYPSGTDLEKQNNKLWNHKNFPKPLDYYNSFDNNDGFFAIDYTAEAFENDVDSTYILSDFLNRNFNNYDEYFVFFTKYLFSFINFFEDEDIKKLEFNHLYSFKEINDLAQKYHPIIINFIIEKQSDIKEIIDYSYNYDTYNNELQRFSAYRLVNHKKYDYFSSNIKQIGLSYDVSLDNNKKVHNMTCEQLLKEFDNWHIRPIYTNEIVASNIFGYFYYMTYTILKNYYYNIKKCKNCSKYYIVENSSKQLYCDNLYNENQTCRDIGNQLAQLKKQQDDLVYGKYRKIYAKKAMLVKRNPDIESYKIDYENWKKEAQEYRDKLKKEKITNEEFEKWLDTNK